MAASADKTKRYIVRKEDPEPYSPANHSGTVNRRMIGKANVGAGKLEVVLGEVVRGQGAHRHAHPGIEQVCYMLEGRARVEVDGVDTEIGPGDACFFPADVEHVFTAVTDKVRVLVIYSPPYGENPNNARVPKG